MTARTAGWLSALVLLGGTSPAASQADPAAPRLGTLTFPTSGSAAAQAAFLTGVLYLHSFEYESSLKYFRQAEALEPSFAMAYWGEAMTYTHGVWNEQDAPAARAALQRLGATPEARAARAPTAREQRYLSAVEALYGDGSKPRRDTLYSGVMEQVVREFPDDMEAKAFYALSLLSLNQGIRDTVTYLRAAPYADTVFRGNPTHPGAVHYLIHSYDDPIHAPMGLEAARAYSRIAPDAAHAQHMTTHIFLALGMWDEVISQNRIALGTGIMLPGHYSSWLIYGMLQEGRYSAVEDLISSLRKAIGDTGRPSQYSALVDMRAHYLLHSDDYRSGAARYRIPYEKMTVEGHIEDLYADGVMAYRRHDADEMGRAATELTRQVEALRIDRGPANPITITARLMARALGGMALFLGDAREAGVHALREAAALEDALPMEFGPPLVFEPTHEVLGTMLLELDPDAAVREFEQALRRAPGRTRALIGLARAAVASGDKAAAQRAIAHASSNWHHADPKVRAELGPLIRVIERMP